MNKKHKLGIHMNEISILFLKYWLNLYCILIENVLYNEIMYERPVEQTLSLKYVSLGLGMMKLNYLAYQLILESF